jgi:hypothetical protein
VLKTVVLLLVASVAQAAAPAPRLQKLDFTVAPTLKVEFESADATLQRVILR